MECRWSVRSTLIIYPLPNEIASVRCFAAFGNRDGLKSAGRCLLPAGLRDRKLIHHKALYRLQ